MPNPYYLLLHHDAIPVLVTRSIPEAVGEAEGMDDLSAFTLLRFHAEEVELKLED